MPDVKARVSTFSIQWCNKNSSVILEADIDDALGSFKETKDQVDQICITYPAYFERVYLSYDDCNHCQGLPFSPYDFMQTLPFVSDVKSNRFIIPFDPLL